MKALRTSSGDQCQVLLQRKSPDCIGSTMDALLKSELIVHRLGEVKNRKLTWNEAETAGKSAATGLYTLQL